MNNLRIVYNNAADRAALTAASQAGALGPANLQTDIKSSILRSTGLTQTITATWPTQEAVACVALMYTNLTSSARMRVRGYAQPGDTTPVLDTGYVYPSKEAVHGSYPWGTMPLGWNAYRWGGVNTWAQGGGSDAVVWFDSVRVRRLVIDVDLRYSQEAYIEASRLVVGDYWEPENSADSGAALQIQDTSDNYRTAAGDLRTSRGVTSDKISINMSHLDLLDRAKLMRILRECGKDRAMLFSLFPDNPDEPLVEQDHMIYGKLSNLDAVVTPYYQNYSAPLQIEGI